MSETILEKVHNVKNIDARVEATANKICAQSPEIDRDFILVQLYGLVVGIEAEIIKAKK